MYLRIQQGERFAGTALALAGLLWSVSALDVYPPWGPICAWLLAGLAYPPFAWGILRFRRPRLVGPVERLFPAAALLASLGTTIVVAPLVKPSQLGMSADAIWPVGWYGGIQAPGVAAVALSASFSSLTVYFILLMARILRNASTLSRGFLRPMMLFGAFGTVGAAVIQALSIFFPHVVDRHQATLLVGCLLLLATTGLGISLVLQNLLGSRLVALLPQIRTPETITAYIRTVLDDRSAELLFWPAESEIPVDGMGRSWTSERAPEPDRFAEWIHGSDGARIALLTGSAALRSDPSAIRSLAQLLSIIAENARLAALLRWQVAQLTAAGIAEKLAFHRAREQFRRDLHDGVQQTIASARLDLDGLREAVGADAVQAMVTALEAKLVLALDQVHSLARGVRPPELRVGLGPAIDRTVAELRLDAKVAVPEIDLGALTQPIYYVVRELLTNVHKHANARRVEVTITAGSHSVDVEVSDDGAGGAIPPDGSGLTGIQRRAHELGGTVTISSRATCGTTVRVSIPCVSP